MSSLHKVLYSGLAAAFILGLAIPGAVLAGNGRQASRPAPSRPASQAQRPSTHNPASGVGALNRGYTGNSGGSSYGGKTFGSTTGSAGQRGSAARQPAGAVNNLNAGRPAIFPSFGSSGQRGAYSRPPTAAANKTGPGQRANTSKPAPNANSFGSTTGSAGQRGSAARQPAGAVNNLNAGRPAIFPSFGSSGQRGTYSRPPTAAANKTGPGKTANTSNPAPNANSYGSNTGSVGQKGSAGKQPTPASATAQTATPGPRDADTVKPSSPATAAQPPQQNNADQTMPGWGNDPSTTANTPAPSTPAASGTSYWPPGSMNNNNQPVTWNPGGYGGGDGGGFATPVLAAPVVIPNFPPPIPNPPLAFPSESPPSDASSAPDPSPVTSASAVPSPSPSPYSGPGPTASASPAPALDQDPMNYVVFDLLPDNVQVGLVEDYLAKLTSTQRRAWSARHSQDIMAMSDNVKKYIQSFLDTSK